MKYIHGFLSRRLKEENISHDESLVIRYLLNFINSNKMEKILVDGEFYYWVKYEKVVTDLEILGIKKQAISDMLIYDLGEKPNDWEERLNSMKESSRKRKAKSKFIGIFKRYTKKDADGTRSYFAPTEKLYSLLPSITEDDEDMKNKKDLPAPTDKPQSNSNKNSNSNNSIPQNEAKDTDKKEKSEIIKLIDDSCVNIRKQDLKKCEEEFTDIDKLKEALSICEMNNSHGIKALRMAYKTLDNQNTFKPRFKPKYDVADSKILKDGEYVSVRTLSNKEFEIVSDYKFGSNNSGYNPHREIRSYLDLRELLNYCENIRN